MASKKYKRRQFIVDPAFQYRLIRRIMGLALLMIAMSIAFLVVVYAMYGDIQFQLAQPDPFASGNGTGSLVVQKSLLGLLWPILAICLGIAVLVTLVFGVLVSHRMAGPVFRIRRVLGEMQEGNLQGDIHLRRKDDFKSLAESINEMKRNWRETVKALRSVQRQLEAVDTGPCREPLDKLDNVLSRFTL